MANLIDGIYIEEVLYLTRSDLETLGLAIVQVLVWVLACLKQCWIYRMLTVFCFLGHSDRFALFTDANKTSTCTHEENAGTHHRDDKLNDTKLGEQVTCFENKNFLQAYEPVTVVSLTSLETTSPNKSRQERSETKDDEKMTVT